MTIKTKIILGYTAVFGVMISLFAFVIYQGTKEAEMTKLDARLASHADKILTELEEQSDEAVFPDVGQILAIRTDGLTAVHIQLIDRAGKMIIPDGLLSAHMSTHRREMFIDVPRKEIIPIGDQQYRCLWVQTELNDRSQYLVELAAPMSDVEASLQHLRFLFLTSIPLALLLTAFMAYLITRTAFRPMLGMAKTAQRITATNLHQRLSLPNTKDEVRLLGETFNKMIERIDAAFDSQKQFVADASHEIRTPLTVICTELEYAEQRITDPAIKESIQTSLAEIDRLAKLSDGLLLLAKLDASQLKLDIQPVRLDELLVECVQRVGIIAEKKNIEMRVDVQEAIELAADREKLKSIIFNLLDNAVKYSPSNTIVSSSLSFKDHQRHKILLTISDQGPGISASALPNIFKRFYRVDSARTDTPGIGLGLAIVERLVELHGGNLSVRSEEGKGSEFCVELAHTDH